MKMSLTSVVRLLVLIKNERGLSSTEVLIAIAFLGIMVFFSYQMLLRQQTMVKRVNQNVEATTLLFEMRKYLSGLGCKENLAGFSRILGPGTITSLKKLVTYPDGTSEIVNVFETSDLSKEPYSETGLKVRSYQLDPKGLNEPIRTDKTYLIVNFDRGFDGPGMRRQIKIYTQETNGVITNCSLVPFMRNSGAWLQVGNELKLKVDKVGVGTKDLRERLNIKGGLYATPPTGGCNQNSFGTVFFNSSAKAWELCTSKGVIPLTDSRRLPE